MSLSKITGLILGSAALVAGHGYVSGVVVDDVYYGGYIVTEYPYESDPPEIIAWSEQETDLGYIDGSEYANSNIICHKDAQPGALEAPVTAGGSVELQWTTWPTSHHGPVITYMANCNGDCADVDKTTLEFFKIDQGGLVSDTTEPGTWATDNLIANNNSRTVTVPSDIADGNYVLRHEIIALHSAEETDGAQNYPQCINLKVTGGGSATPSGVLGTALYKNTDPGILINIYTSLSTYDIPGPTLYTAGAAAATTSATTTAAAAATTSSAAAVTTTAAAATTASAETTTSSASSVDSVVHTTTPSASIVSASPTWSPSSLPPFSNSTRAWRPSFTRQPGSRVTSAPTQVAASTGAQLPSTTAITTATPVVITLTETSTSWVTELVTHTDSSVVQTTSAVPVVVAVTTTITDGSAPTETSSPSTASGSSSSSSGSSSSGSGSESSGSGSGSVTTTSVASTTSSAESSDYDSSDWTTYLSSLTAAEVLQLLRQTFKWLVSNDKVHARDITMS
ncbi:hypothetical protein N7466_011014 [Penicillium verhagenii]|uniref:uncharacterized protein n=1 Tax=Penicillium verhagenii TaxID=1562060 RepID=UPI00254568D3|nr:uncharacterized protein N7466_011014 [Penicillium verhagenii]KAJ5917460.1 hypothetical protein N7466_011014 [Penicillium verhagenii]